MKKYNFLVLTDHTRHSAENSLYALVTKLKAHPQCGELYVASRGNDENDSFFEKGNYSNIHGYRVKKSLSFEEVSKGLLFETQILSQEDFDVVFMRLPRPVSTQFLMNLADTFNDKIFINHPIGIEKTGTKKFLLNFPEVCPPIRLCHSIEEITDFSKQFPLVLKPLREYGGKGIFRLEGEVVYEGKESFPATEYLQKREKEIRSEGILAMKFLKNVSQGDKRILVVNGKILAASLRLPAEGSWLCNVAQGGSSVKTELTPEEETIIAKISPILLKEGIVIFGADTLVDDEGKRVLSEVNTLSIGGFPQSEKQTGRPIVQQAIDGIFDYVNQVKENR